MKCFHFILIIFLSSNVLNAIYILSNKFRLMSYGFAKTKIYMYSAHKFKRKNEGTFEVTIMNESHQIYVKPCKIPHLYTNVSEILFLHGNSTTKEKFDIYPWNIVEGFVEDCSNNSGVNGFIKNGEFYGTIIFKDKLYYIEEKSRLPAIKSSESNRGFNAIIYSENSILNEKEDKPYERNSRQAWHHKILMNDEASKIVYKQFIADRYAMENSFPKDYGDSQTTLSTSFFKFIFE